MSKCSILQDTRGRVSALETSVGGIQTQLASLDTLDQTVTTLQQQLSSAADSSQTAKIQLAARSRRRDAGPRHRR
eukprot:scaffold223494_cov27-Tisochrysis_lutea.AAC.2